MNTRGYFVTGTDTDCGKTEVTLGLMHLLQARGYRVLGMKPVAAGAELGGEGLCNRDALRIQALASRQMAYRLVNPWVFEPAVAPHLAAARVGVEIGFPQIRQAFRILAGRSDRLLVEGAGGWQVPLGRGRSMADLAVMLELPVILVVGLRLGCINHALLTCDAILASGLPLAGWVANQVDPGMRELAGNLKTLRERISAPLIGVVPWLERPAPEAIAACLTLAEFQDM
jgi:dethiobiotin synthetase